MSYFALGLQHYAMLELTIYKTDSTDNYKLLISRLKIKAKGEFMRVKVIQVFVIQQQSMEWDPWETINAPQ